MRVLQIYLKDSRSCLSIFFQHSVFVHSAITLECICLDLEQNGFLQRHLHISLYMYFQDHLHLYLHAQNCPETHVLNIATIGAGATVDELSAELGHAKSTFFKYGLNKIDPNKVKVTLIEAADRILPALSTKMATHTYSIGKTWR